LTSEVAKHGKARNLIGRYPSRKRDDPPDRFQSKLSPGQPRSKPNIPNADDDDTSDDGSDCSRSVPSNRSCPSPVLDDHSNISGASPMVGNSQDSGNGNLNYV
jgi:hypothetical protein